MSELKEKDLAPHARRALDKAYDRRIREKASKNDVAEGFIGALVFLNSRSSFKESAQEAFEEERRRI